MLVGTLNALIASTLDDTGINALLLTNKKRYSVSIRPKKNVCVFTFNPLPRVVAELFLKLFDGL